MDSNRRIEQLEARLTRVTAELEDLRGRVEAHPDADSRDNATGPGWPRRASFIWLARFVLVLMTAAVASATVLHLKSQGLSWSRVTELAPDLAALPIDYKLLACAVLVAFALVFYASRRWLTFFGAALFAMYLTFHFYFTRAGLVPVSEDTWFWLSNGFLVLTYLLFSMGCVSESRNVGRRGRAAALLALVNSGLFFYFAGGAVDHRFPEHYWVFPIVFTFVLAVFAVLAETSGPRSNYLFQLFIAKALVVFTLAMSELLAGHWLCVVMALECLVLAVAYHRSGVVLLKVLNLVLLLVTFVLCVQDVRGYEIVQVGDYAIPATWILGGCVPALFLFIGWYYEKFANRLSPEERRLSGHWFLADTFLDAPCATAAMLHAAAAALIPATITIIAYGDQTTLPYILTIEALAFAVLGFAIRTAQVEVGAVLLLAAAHVSVYFFLAIGKSGFEESVWFLPATWGMVLLTYAAGWRWERYVRRIPARQPWEHHIVAVLPHLLATAMAATLLGRIIDGVEAPLAQNGLGLALMLVGLKLRYPSLTIAGLAAFVYGTATFAGQLLRIDGPVATTWDFPLWLLAVLATFVAAERLLAAVGRREKSSGAERVTRTLLVVTAAALGSAGLNEWAPDDQRTLLWLGLAAASALAGLLFSDSRYRWAGFAVFVVATVAALQIDAPRLPSRSLYYRIVAGLVVVVVLVLSWTRAFRQRRAAERPSASD